MYIKCAQVQIKLYTFNLSISFPSLPSHQSVAVELLDEDDEYESLPPSASILVQGMAGSIAGVVEHTCFFPVDGK